MVVAVDTGLYVIGAVRVRRANDDASATSSIVTLPRNPWRNNEVVANTERMPSSNGLDRQCIDLPVGGFMLRAPYVYHTNNLSHVIFIHAHTHARTDARTHAHAHIHISCLPFIGCYITIYAYPVMQDQINW